MIAARKGLAVYVRVNLKKEHWLGARTERGVDVGALEDIVRHGSVEAWDDDGVPLVLGDRGLVRADWNVVEIAEECGDEITGVATAAGWVLWERHDEDSEWEALPIAAWGLSADGDVVPICVEDDRYLNKYETVHGGRNVEIRHESQGRPDAPRTTAATTTSKDGE